MKKTPILAFVLILCLLPGFASAVTGFAFPLFEGQKGDLEPYQQLLSDQKYDDAVMGLSLYILTHQKGEQLGRAFTYLGMALFKSQRYEQAGDNFLMASLQDPDIPDLAALYRIYALESENDAETGLKSIDQFRQRFSTSLHQVELPETRARLLKAGGKFTDAAIAYENMAGDTPNEYDYSKYTVEAARCYLLGKDEKKAKEAVARVLFRVDPGRYTEGALEVYLKLYGTIGPQLHTTGLSWYSKGDKRAAAPILLDLLQKQIKEGKSGDELVPLIEKVADAHYSIHENVISLKYFNMLIEDHNYRDRAEAIYRKAKLLTRMGDNKASRAAFAQVLKEHPSSGYVPASKYQLALIDMEDNQYKAAYKYFKWRLTKSGGPREYLTWLAAWTAYRNGYLDTSAGYLDDLLKKYTRSRDYDRYRFWRARIHAEKKEDKKATAIYQSLNNNNPLTYYGMKSYDELKKRKLWGRSIATVLGTGKKNAATLPETTIDVFDAEDQAAAKRLQAITMVGMKDQAEREIGLLAGKYEDNKPALYALSDLYQQNDQFRSAMNLARSGSLYTYCKGFADPIGKAYFRFTYPRGFPDLVEPWAKKRKLPPEVVYALIHQESTYRPKVVSPAHAVGLMQIIPKTGREIAADLDVPDFRVEDLYDPAINVRFGTWYLRKVLDKFNNHLPCALASYNAGPDVVSKWVRNKGDLPVELYIEEIPYQETSNYVRKILTNIAIYKALYDLG